MQRIYCAALALSVLVLTIASCGGNGGGLDDSLAAPTGVIGEAVAEIVALPDFNALEGLERGISRAGGGWHELPVTGMGLVDISSSATPGNEGLLLEAADGPAWFAWGVSEIKDGLYVDAVQLDVQDEAVEYFIAASDFGSGRWTTFGPFSGGQEVIYPESLAGVSAAGKHYFAVILPEGSLTVEACSFRIAGDDGDAPFPVTMSPDYSGKDIFLSWWQSPSYADLDFAGYRVARSDYIGDNYVFLNSEPFLENQYVDDTAEDGQFYRYIVYACDTAGRQTPGSVVVDYTNPNADNPPVVVVSHTPGPLTFPATVQIDLSGSYDPDGDPIEQYEVSVGTNYIKISQDDPRFSIELPTGGYRVDVRVSNNKTSYSWFPMTILPTWEEESRVLLESNHLRRRAFTPRLASDPQTGAPVALYFDGMRSALIASHVTEQGLEEFGSWPFYGQTVVNDTSEYRFISEPVEFNGKLLLQARWGNQRTGLELDANGFRMATYFSSGSNGDAQSDLATDGIGNLWSFQQQGFGNDIIGYQAGGFNYSTIHEGVINPGLLDAEYNPQSGMYELVYTHNGQLMWAVVDPDGGASTKVDILTADVESLDLEYNEYTQRMELAIGYILGIFHADRDALSLVWSGFNQTGPNGQLTTAVDLVIDAEGSYIFAGAPGNKSRIYYDTGNGWTAGQEVGWTDGGYEVSALRLPGDGQTLIMDRSAFSMHVTRLGDQLGQQELALIEGTDFLGLGLTVEDNEDGIYLATRQGLGMAVYGSVYGDSWSLYEDGIGNEPTGIRLSTDKQGGPYLTYRHNAAFLQKQWSGGAFIDLNAWVANDGSQPIVGGANDSLFMLNQSDQLGNGGVVYQIDGNTFNKTYVNGPIRDGVIDGYSTTNFDGVVIYGGTAGYNGSIGFINRLRNDVHFIAEWGSMPYADPLIIGRTIDSAYGYYPGMPSSGGIFYAASGTDGHPLRITRAGTSFHAETIPVGLTDRNQGETRRIVSADNTPMFSGVALISTLQGEVELFEMSTQSGFLPLEFPDIEHGHLYEVVADQFGRWHIIYRDTQTDDLMIRSTVPGAA
ncbi:hypothetical protein KDL29_02670 [bacterium]|nr:hypothetical protein [bacterium]